MTVVLFLIVLAILIFVHELGHFLLAKAAGIRVDEFAIGFPPRLFSFKKGETEYSINLIPFGGYVKIFGEDPNEEDMPKSDEEKRRHFVFAPRYIQALVLVAGVLFNLIFAWLVLSFAFMIGMPAAYVPHVAPTEIRDSRVIIQSIKDGSPAAESNIKIGDIVFSISNESSSIVEPKKIEEVSDVIDSARGEVIVTVKRGEELVVNTMIPQKDDAGSNILGVGIEQGGFVQKNFLVSFVSGFLLIGDMTQSVVTGLYGLVRDMIFDKADFSSVSGPIGIASAVHDASNEGFSYLLAITAFISINLAVVNMVPFPALDGGRLLFLAIEGVIRRRLPSKIMNTANMIGFSILIILMIVITCRDIINFF